MTGPAMAAVEVPETSWNLHISVKASEGTPIADQGMSERTRFRHDCSGLARSKGRTRPQREDNGYRDCDESLVRRVQPIRALLDAGLTTGIIGDVLPPGRHRGLEVRRSDFARRTANERGRPQERASVMAENLQALDDYVNLGRAEGLAAPARYT